MVCVLFGPVVFGVSVVCFLEEVELRFALFLLFRVAAVAAARAGAPADFQLLLGFY